ncbi:MAG: hypothetical protein GX293_01610 [Bacteroidales bacterium]|nr:hypothetical protein [Bacteroidales bacterium]
MMDYRCPDDTCDGDYIQRAIKAANSNTVFFPEDGGMGKKGEYIISRTIILEENSMLVGPTSFGHNYGAKLIKTGNADQYLFEARTDTNTTAVTFKNLCFDAKYALDLRQRSGGSPNRCLIDNCRFQSERNDSSGIAVNIWDHNFSVIKESSFYDYKGLCAVKISGRAAPDHRNSTQIKVYDCFFKGSQIGITIEQVNSVIISGCDFAGIDLCCIDIGGKILKENCTNHELTYVNYDQNRDEIGKGAFEDVIIRENHFEGFTRGVTANGHYTLNFGLRIENNSFIQEKNAFPDAVMMEFNRVTGATTYNNTMLFAKGKLKNVSRNNITGIQYSNCKNPRFLLDNFICDVGEESGLFRWANDYKDKGNNVNPLIVKGHGKNRMITNAGPYSIKGNIELSKEGTLSGELKEIKTGHQTPVKKSDLSIFCPISANEFLESGCTAILMDNFSSNSCGIIMVNVYIDGIGRFLSTWSVGKNSITQISGDSNNSQYSLRIIDDKLHYQNCRSDSRRCFIQGSFIGINYNE